MTLRPLWPAALSLLAVPVILRAQAAVEYAVKSAGSALANGGSSIAGSSIAGCSMDSTVLSCLSHSYPRTTILVAVLTGLLVIRWLAGHAGYGRR